jgi:ubiquitin fusion degradation protein 1
MALLVPRIRVVSHRARRGLGGGFGFPGGQRSNPSSYDEYLKAYSVAMLPGRERENLSYGGKSESPN